MYSKNKTIACSLLCLLVSTAVLCFAQDTNDNGSDEIRQLMSKRVDVLQDRLQRFEHAYEKGSVSLDEYLPKKSELLAAQLEYSSNASERITLRKSHLSSLRELEEQIRLGHEAGRFADFDLLGITADRLKAEIELLREQQP